MKKNIYKIVLLIFIIFLAVSIQFSQEKTINKVFELTENKQDENYLFWDPGSFDIDEKGSIYIADTKNSRIQKFDEKGKYTITIGQKGDGPGEFIYPYYIRISGDKIFVFDAGNVRISKFSLEGKFIDSDTAGRMFSTAVFDYEGNIYTKVSSPVGFGGAKPQTLEKYNSKGDFEFKLGERVFSPSSAVKTVSYGSGGSGTGYVSIFGSNILCAVDKTNNVYINYPYNSSKIVKYSPDGTELLTIDPKIEKLKVSEEDKTFLLKKFESYDSINIPKEKPSIMSIDLDDDNNIWIATREGENQGEIHFHVLSREGKYIYKAKITTKNPRNALRIRIKKDNIYILYKSEVEDVRFIKYNIIGNS
ncbi:MAG: NHL repeat-containing protein [Candidatus Aminicenantes bacterium]|nr:NHL repeat-containing protein [Candidatus Aminicenantes bacterium]